MQNTLTRSPRLRLMAVCLFLVFAPVTVHPQDTPASVSVIPQPRELTVTNELFRLQRAQISLADPHSADDQFAAADFVDDVKQTAGASLKITRGRNRHQILIGL